MEVKHEWSEIPCRAIGFRNFYCTSCGLTAQTEHGKEPPEFGCALKGNNDRPVIRFTPGKLTNIDDVNHPSHYTAGKVECIEALEAATVNLTGIEAVCTANAIKYLWRWKQKNGLQDLKKAKWYLERLIATQERVQ